MEMMVLFLLLSWRFLLFLFSSSPRTSQESLKVRTADRAVTRKWHFNLVESACRPLQISCRGEPALCFLS